MGNPIAFVDPDGKAPQDIGLYVVDNQGNVLPKGVKKSNDKYDMIYKKEDWDSKNFKGERINDQSILSQLAENTVRTTASTENELEFSKVAFFMMKNTNVEWAALGFKTDNNTNINVLTTSHEFSRVNTVPEIELNFGIENQIYDIHSHPSLGGTKGASHDDELYDDMDRVRSKYNQFIENGGTHASFAKHYVYHKQSGNMYQYTPWDSSIYSGKVFSYLTFKKFL